MAVFVSYLKEAPSISSDREQNKDIKMNKWKAYGSVSDLVKQFETTKAESAISLKKFQSVENIKKSQNFKNIYHKFENQDIDFEQSNLAKHETTNHLECLQLQEIKQASKKLYAITWKLENLPDATVDPSCLEEVGRLILDVGNVCDYGHASIKSEKAQILPLLHRYYLYIRDKMKRENLRLEEDSSVKRLVGKNGLVDKKLPPKPPLRLKDLISSSNDNSNKLGDEINASKEVKRNIQRKYEKNPSIQQTLTSNQEVPKKTSIISRKISKLQTACGQEVQLRPKPRTYSQQTQGQSDNKRNTWESTGSTLLGTTNRYRSVYSQENNSPVPNPRYGSNIQRSRSFGVPKANEDFDQKNRWDTMSNCSEFGSKRNSWYGYRRSPDSLNNNQDRYDTESDTGSILSGHEMFEQKYSGIAEKINDVLKKRISKLEDVALLH